MSGVNYAQSLLSAADTALSGKKIAVMAQNQVPLDTSVNYTSTTLDGVVCLSAMPKFASKAKASKQAGQAILQSMTSSERKAV